MNKITCDMCMDLMPLVHDGIASKDSRNAVLLHIQDCPKCKALFEGELPAPTDHSQILKNIQRRSRSFVIGVMMFGIFYGLSLTASSELFQNVWIMPLIGATGYYLFRWRGLYIIPGLLFVTHAATNAMGWGEEYLNLPMLLMWTGIYCAAALVGFVIAALLHFAFQKEDNTK